MSIGHGMAIAPGIFQVDNNPEILYIESERGKWGEEGGR
jgi:hypothetical protein